ncbi:MAG: hypothetical protein K0S33_374 [Bacteroidetes bacterium]|jgi:uncharacterized delta-60 repeat protein|nr:hypothetical protein [Bacteroidota bacterium]
MRTIHLLSIIVIAAAATSATAQTPGTLDPTFGTAGKVTTALFNPSINEQDEIRSIAIQADGKIVAAGFSNNGSNGDFSLARYSSAGVLDNTFGLGNGVQKTQMATGNDEGYAVAIQSDGKIVVAGMATAPVTYNKGFALARYTSAGILDTTFGTAGKVIIQPSSISGDTYATCMVLQPDGKIIVAGYADIGANNDLAIARFNSNGTLDTTFGMGGSGCVVQSISGSHDQLNCIALQPDGKIVLAGFTQSTTNVITKDSFITRYNANGTIDNTFGAAGGGIVTNMNTGEDEICSVALQSDGSIVTAGFASNGSNYDIAVARYTGAGYPDLSFNGNGKIIQTVGNSTDVGRAVSIQADGRIVVAGFADMDPGGFMDENFVVLTYHPDGSPDNTFGTSGIANTQFYPSGVRKDVAKAIAIQTDGKIVVGGYMENATDYDYALARYYPAVETTAVSAASAIQRDVSFYPNPTAGMIEIRLGRVVEHGTIEVVNLMGQLVIKEEIRNANAVSVEIPGAEGLYFVTITDTKGYKAVVKVMKQ